MKTLIITSGGSQLISQITVLRQSLFAKGEVELMYNGVARSSLDTFFNEVSIFFGYKYLGQFNFNMQPEKIAARYFLLNLIKKKNPYLNLKIETNFPFLKNLRNFDLLILPIRVKMFSDSVLLNYLKPKKIIYVIDGIVDELPKRNYQGLRFHYLKNFLSQLPVNSKVYSPNYLQRDAELVGKYEEINTKEVLGLLFELPIVKKFKREYLLQQINYVIFSQHFSLNEGILFENEIEYYNRIINSICEDISDGLILFKPHPRDTTEKINKINKAANNKLLVVDKYYQAIPVELFVNEFISMETTFITGNSSAPFCFNKKESIVSVYSDNLLSNDLNKKIKEFAVTNKVKLKEV